MTKRTAPFAFLAAAALVGGAAAAFAQVPPPGPPPRPQIFVDGPGLDIGSLRAEIPFVEFVPEPGAAQVRVVIAPSGPPGRGMMTLQFSGLGPFQGDDNALTYVPPVGASPEEVRKGLAGTLRLGLLRYAAKAPVARDLTVTFLDQAKPTSVNDPWNFWIFSLSGNAFLSGETLYSSKSHYASVSANRVTPALKVQAQVYGNLNDSRFDFGDGTIYESETHGLGGSALVVKSLGEHWSAGGYIETESSTFSNLRLGVTAAPALEYDVFPYSESTKRQFRILYRIGLTRARYYEETVYFKTAETLLQESLNFAYEVVQPWGKTSIQLQGSHYFHDVSKNRIELRGDLELRVWRGLSFEIGASYTRIRDQLALSAGGASYEDILLRQRQLATGYEYSLSFGFIFSFGSTRSDVVNPRFGNGGRRFYMGM